MADDTEDAEDTERLEESVDQLVDELRATRLGDDGWRSAVEGLAQLGYPAVSLLLNALRDRQLSVYVGVSNALKRIGPCCKYDLIEELRSGDEHTRCIVAGLVGGFLQQDATLADEAVPALAEALSDGDCFVRQKAAQALSWSGPQGEPAIPALILCLRDENYGVREWAALALGFMGAAARDAIPALTELLLDDVPPVRAAASGALDQILSQ